jgi:hypothetical protein
LRAPLNDCITMSTFVQEEVTTWVQACEEEGALRAAGASAEELEAARLRVIIGLVSLVSPPTEPETFVALFNLMVQDTTTTVTTDDPIVTTVAETAEATEEVENAD